MILKYRCSRCHSAVWANDRDVAARIRAQAGICGPCDRDAAEDVRVYFAAVVRRERPAPVIQAEPYPSTLGFVLAGLVVLATGSVFLAPFAVEAFTVGSIAAGIFWFAQLVGRFLA